MLDKGSSYRTRSIPWTSGIDWDMCHRSYKVGKPYWRLHTKSIHRKLEILQNRMKKSSKNMEMYKVTNIFKKTVEKYEKYEIKKNMK